MKKYYLRDYDGTYLKGIWGEGWTSKRKNAKAFYYFSAVLWKLYLNSTGFYLEIEKG